MQHVTTAGSNRSTLLRFVEYLSRTCTEYGRDKSYGMISRPLQTIFELFC
jgi:hypothetical protein